MILFKQNVVNVHQSVSVHMITIYGNTVHRTYKIYSFHKLHGGIILNRLYDVHCVYRSRDMRVMLF